MYKYLKFALLYPVSVVVLFVQLFTRVLVSDSVTVVFLLSYLFFGTIGFFVHINVLMASLLTTLLIFVVWTFILIRSYYSSAYSKTNKIYWDYNLMLIDGSSVLLEKLDKLVEKTGKEKDKLTEKDFLFRGVLYVLALISVVTETFSLRPSFKVNIGSSAIAGFFAVRYIQSISNGADWNMFHWPFFVQILVFGLIFVVVRLIINSILYFPSYREWKSYEPRLVRLFLLVAQKISETYEKSTMCNERFKTVVSTLDVYIKSIFNQE